MELATVDELRKRRRKLVKLLEAPLDLQNDFEREMYAATNATLRKLISDIDTEIRERTAGQRGIAGNSS